MRIYRTKELERAAAFLMGKHRLVMARQINNPTPSIRFRLRGMPADALCYEWRTGPRDDFSVVEQWAATGGLLYANRPMGSRDDWGRVPLVGGLVITDIPLYGRNLTPLLALCTDDLVIYEYGSYLPHEEALTDRHPSVEKVRAVLALLRQHDAQDATEALRLVRRSLKAEQGFLASDACMERAWSKWLWHVLGGMLAPVYIWRPLMAELPEYMAGPKLNCLRLADDELMWVEHASASGRFSSEDRLLFRQAVKDGYLAPPTLQWFASFEALHVDEVMIGKIHRSQMQGWKMNQKLVAQAEPLILPPLGGDPAPDRAPLEPAPAPDELPY